MAIAAESTQTLLAGLREALESSDTDRPSRLVSATVQIDADVDPAAFAAGSRLASDRWFCWEQPDRGFALAGIGAAAPPGGGGGGRASAPPPGGGGGGGPLRRPRRGMRAGDARASRRGAGRAARRGGARLGHRLRLLPARGIGPALVLAAAGTRHPAGDHPHPRSGGRLPDGLDLSRARSGSS